MRRLLGALGALALCAGIAHGESITTTPSIYSVAGRTGAVTLTCSDLTDATALCSSTDAAGLSGTIASGRVSGNYTGITGTGTLTAGATGAGFTVALGTSTVTGALPSANGGAGSISGILKANGSGTVSAAVAATDYAPATSGSSILKGDGAGGFSAYAGATCTNQAVTAISAAGAGTCNSITNSYLTAGTFSNITGTGTLTAGTWNATVIGSTYGGTGVNNGSSTITLGGNLTTSGAFATTLTVTATTNATLPAGTKTLMATDYTGASTTTLGSTALTMGGTTSSISGLTLSGGTLSGTTTLNGGGVIDTSGNITLHGGGIFAGEFFVSQSNAGTSSYIDMPNSAGITALTRSTSVVGLIIRGMAGQSSALQQWNVNGGSPLAAVSAAGNFDAVSFSAGGTAGASCAANSVTLLTEVVTNGIITHC